MGATANYTTIMLNASDIIRHIKPRSQAHPGRDSAFANYFGIIPPWMFMFVSGIVIVLATGASEPIAGLVMLSPTPMFGVILLIFIILAQVTSNLTLNILPPALAFQDVFRINWKKGVILVAILSVAVCPWILFTSTYFFTFQNVYSCFLGPALGVMIADYYIIRKKKLNLSVLYDDKGIYTYRKGFSVAGMVSLGIGAIISGIFFNYSWLVGFPATVIIYTLLKRGGIEKAYEIKESEAA
jgi:NCS1 family nucleobase:cation symporter-1